MNKHKIFEEPKESCSSVWLHFLREKSGGFAKCKKCDATIKTSGSSTSGLHTHLRSKHNLNVLKNSINQEAVEQMSVAAKKKPKITDFFDRTKDDSLAAVLSRLVAKDAMPFGVIVTSSEIRKGLIARGFSNLPTSSNTIRKKVEEYHEHIQQQIILKISLLNSKILIDSKKSAFVLTNTLLAAIENILM
jgi:hypothetical protein